MISISVEPGPAVSSFVDVVLECCKTVISFKPVTDLHISLTRTVVLRHHWIQSFTESVQQCIKELPRSVIAVLILLWNLFHCYWDPEVSFYVKLIKSFDPAESQPGEHFPVLEILHVFYLTLSKQVLGWFPKIFL